MRRSIFIVTALLLAAVASAHAEERHFSFTSGGGPRLGVQVVPLTQELRGFFGAQQDAGVLIGKIEPGSAGEKAGLRVGDVLVAVGGVTVDDAGDVRRALGDHKEGEMLPVTVVRERKPLTLAVRVPKAEPAPEGFLPPEGMGFPPDGARMFRLGDLEQRLDAIEKRLQKLEERR